MLKFFKKAGPQAVWLASASFCVKACVNEEMSLTNKENENRQKDLMTKRVYEPQIYWCPAGGALLTHKESIALVSNVDTPVCSAK